MIYTDGVGTIANVREDTGKKVTPHKEYVSAAVAAAKDMPWRAKVDLAYRIHPAK